MFHHNMLVVPLAAVGGDPVHAKPEGSSDAKDEREACAGAGAPRCGDGASELPSSMPSYARVSASLERDLGRVYLATRQARRIAVVCGT